MQVSKTNLIVNNQIKLKQQMESKKENYDFKVGDTVIVADPKPNDLWNHSFMGEITNVEEDLGLCVIVDGDGDFWDVDFDRLEKQDY